MIPTPAEVAPLVEPLARPIYDALRVGLEFAAATIVDHDPAFHSHCVRYRSKIELAAEESASSWSLVPHVENSGIHFAIGGLHSARLLHAFGGQPPHPGSSRTRRRAWTNVDRPVQLELELEDINAASAGPACGPLSILFDWCVVDDEPVVHVSLPQEAWSYGSNPRLHWRVRLNDPGSWMERVEFQPMGDDAEPLVMLDVDTAAENPPA